MTKMMLVGQQRVVRAAKEREEAKAARAKAEAKVPRVGAKVPRVTVVLQQARVGKPVVVVGREGARMGARVGRVAVKAQRAPQLRVERVGAVGVLMPPALTVVRRVKVARLAVGRVEAKAEKVETRVERVETFRAQTTVQQEARVEKQAVGRGEARAEKQAVEKTEARVEKQAAERAKARVQKQAVERAEVRVERTAAARARRVVVAKVRRVAVVAAAKLMYVISGRTAVQERSDLTNISFLVCSSLPNVKNTRRQTVQYIIILIITKGTLKNIEKSAGHVGGWLATSEGARIMPRVLRFQSTSRKHPHWLFVKVK